MIRTHGAGFSDSEWSSDEINGILQPYKYNFKHGQRAVQVFNLGFSGFLCIRGVISFIASS